MKSKNVLLTGASRGVGLVIARHLIEDGYRVFTVSRSLSPELEALQTEYSESLFHVAFDLANTPQITPRIFPELVPMDTPLCGFVNNAALAYDDLVTNLQLEPLERMYRVNVFAPMMLTKGAIRNMLLHRTPGSIVHISSISVHTGYKGLAMYASTKGALEAFSKNTAREWGERGIRSNCVVAGFLETEMSAGLSDEQRQRIYNRTALKQPTDIASVAETVTFLLSEKSRSITGQHLFVDSGTI